MDRHADYIHLLRSFVYLCLQEHQRLINYYVTPRLNLRRCKFSIFPGGHAPDPLVLVCFTCLCASHTMSVNMPASPTSTMMTGLVVPPPFQKSRSAPG